ncbi:MAG TPA: hypothetical protein PKZ16_02500 [bacterium]|nr:hypothetical protein [bacterium]HPL95770.1 hypothetical protein [bacterium]
MKNFFSGEKFFPFLPLIIFFVLISAFHGLEAATTVSGDVSTGSVYLGSQGIIYQNDLQVLNASSTNYSVTVGTEAGKDLNNSGTNNIFIGYQAGYTATSTIADIGIGYRALYNAKRTGTWDYSGYNVAIGDSALFSNTLGFDNIAIGYYPLYENTTGFYNIAMGRQALEKNTTGDSNIALGYYAGWANTTGTRNISVGYQAGYYGATVSGNVAVGSDALIYNVNGSWNTAVGDMALGYLWTQSFANTALGYQAGRGNSSAIYSNSSSTWVGYQAGVAIRTGNSNMGLGYKAGDNLTTGSNNIVIGYDIDAPAATSNYTLNIGNILFGDGLNGTGTTIRGRIGIATSTPWRTASQDYGFVIATSTFITANATTTADLVIGTETTAATTTLKIKADATGANGSSCIEMKDVEGTSYIIYINAGTLKIEAGTCK